MKPPYRVVRSAAFSAICSALTLFGHWTVSRDPVSAGTVLGALLATGCVAYLLGGHERSLPVIFGALLGGQFTLHAYLSSAGHHAPVAAAKSLSPAMTAAHLGAAAGCAWWLRRGERAAWALARRLGVRLLFAPGAVRLRVPDVVPRPVAPVRPATPLLRYVHVLRGPPASSLVAR